MTKFTVFVIVTLLTICQGYPDQDFDIANAAMSGNFQSLFNLLGKQREPFAAVFTGSNIKDLKPESGGGKVYGEAQYAIHEVKTDENGRVFEKSTGHRILNDNGRITEYDFNPAYPQIG